MYLIMLDKLMDHCESHRRYELGLTYGALILRCERARERTHRRLMRLHCLAGDRTAALRQYERCVCALHEELGVRPAGHTDRLYQQIRADGLNDSVPMPSASDRISETADSPLPELLSHLKQLQSILTDVQNQVHRNIQAVELAMNDPS